MSTTHTDPQHRGHHRLRLGTALVALAAVVFVALPGAPSASAAPVTASGATLTWKISEHAWTSTSLAPSHLAEGGATKGENGFVFAGGGQYDLDTGVSLIHFAGSVTLGNTNQGGYKIKFADPVLTTTDDGFGTVTADVSFCAHAGACADPGFTTVDDVVIAELAALDPEAAEGEFTLTTTPIYALQADQELFPGRKQFPQELIDALPASLQNHFRDSGSTSDPNKAPAPMTIAFAFGATTTTSSSTTSSSSSTSTSSTSSTSSTTSSTLAPEEGNIEAGTLDWGVKESFRNYVVNPAIANGSVTVGGGATVEGAVYRFQPGSGTYESAEALAAAFGGNVNFTGHDGELDLTISEPRVSIVGDEGQLIVDVSSLALEAEEPEIYDDVAIADLDLSGVAATAVGEQVVFANVPAVLTAAGAPAFGGFYEAGAALDPVTMTLTVADPGELPPPTTPTTASVGCLDKTTVAVGAAINACGAGFQAGEQVQVFLHSTPVFVKVLTADSTGAVTTSVTIPAGTAAGAHRIELRGVTSGRSLFSSEFTVTAAGGGSGLPKTGSPSTDLALVALLIVGLGMIMSGRSMVRSNRGR